MVVTVHVKLQLVDNKTQKPIYQSADTVFRDEYQISSDVSAASSEEQKPGALDRMSHDLASHLVANVMENF